MTRGYELHVLNAETEGDLDAAFATAIDKAANALLVGPEPFFNSRRDRIVALAARRVIPTIYSWREYPLSGGLISYGANLYEQYRVAGSYVGRILKGIGRPAGPTANEAGACSQPQGRQGARLDVPPSLLARADEVIEMKRREFITLLGGAGCTTLAARAQQLAVPVVGFLSSESPVLFAVSAHFPPSLSETGYVEGQNVAIEYRWAEGQNDRLPTLAADLVRRQVSVIAAPATTPAALAAKAATATIPIVILTAGDPVALGLVASLDHPGGNITGAASWGGELAPKRMELLHELMPTATMMALLVNPTNPALASRSTTREVQAAARTLGLKLHILRASAESDFDTVFATMLQLKATALEIAIDSFFTARREQLAELAPRHRVPAIYQYRDFARPVA